MEQLLKLFDKTQEQFQICSVILLRILKKNNVNKSEQDQKLKCFELFKNSNLRYDQVQSNARMLSVNSIIVCNVYTK